MASRINTFYKRKNEDADLYIKQVKYNYAERQEYFESSAEFEDAKLTALIINTAGNAHL